MKIFFGTLFSMYIIVAKKVTVFKFYFAVLEKVMYFLFYNFVIFIFVNESAIMKKNKFKNFF